MENTIVGKVGFTDGGWNWSSGSFVVEEVKNNMARITHKQESSSGWYDLVTVKNWLSRGCQ